MRLLALWVLIGAAGCLRSVSVNCGDQLCPLGNVCVPGGGCASRGDLQACDGLADGEACTTETGASGRCKGACRPGLCGNHIVDVGEACDDGNQASGDGCRADCGKLEQCGDGVVDDGEACDDGNQNPVDGCDACATSAWQATLLIGAMFGEHVGLSRPAGIAVDNVGRVVIADTQANRVRRLDASGALTTIAGTGVAGASGDGGPAASAQLAHPAAVAVDGIGRVVIADTDNGRIRRIELDGTIVTIAGTSPGYSGDGGFATSARLSDVQGVAVDGLGRIFIGDTSNQRVRMIETDGVITTIAGTGVLGTDALGGPATGAELEGPAGVAVDAFGDVFICDSYGTRILKVDTGHLMTQIATASQPQGLAVDELGRVLVADTHANRIVRVALDGGVTTIAGTGTRGFAGDGAAATSALLAQPEGVAIDGHGGIVIVDTLNFRIRRIAVDGTIATIAGTGAAGAVGDDNAATSATLLAAGIAYDAQGRLLIADAQHARVRRVELDGTIGTIAGTGLPGATGDGGPAATATIAIPSAVAIDATGRIVIADTGTGTIRRIETDGTIATLATGLAGPNGVAIDATGRVVVAVTDANRVVRIALDGSVTAIAGTGVAGFSGDGGAATAAQLASPNAVAIDAAGGVLIADTQNRRVRRIAPDNTIATIAGGGAFLTDGHPATSSQLQSPSGLAIDAMQRLAIADRGDRRVRRIELDGTLATLAGTPGVQMTYAGDGGAATAASLLAPIALAFDATGGLAIADDHWVRRIDGSGTIAAIAGTIDPENTGIAARARLFDPQAIAVGSDFTVAAAGSSGTLEVFRDGRVGVLAGRYPQATPTGALARFRDPTFGDVTGVAIDPAFGAVYVVEGTRVQRVATDGTIERVETSAPLRAPMGIAFDAGALAIADAGDHSIISLDVGTGVVKTIANVAHRFGFAGDGGPATAALLYAPTASARCPNGDRFIADTGNDRVRRIDGVGIITTVIGDGSPVSSGEGAPASAFPVDAPRGVACDAFGNVFVTSTTTVRLLAANDAHVVDGSGAVHTIYRGGTCLTGLAVTGATLEVADACSGLLIELERL